MSIVVLFLRRHPLCALYGVDISVILTVSW